MNASGTNRSKKIRTDDSQVILGISIVGNEITVNPVEVLSHIFR